MENHCCIGVPNTKGDILATKNNGENIHGCKKPYPTVNANSLFHGVWLTGKNQCSAKLHSNLQH